MARRFVERNGFVRHDLCRWDDLGWCKRLPNGCRLYLTLSINPTTQYAKPADEAAFQVFQAALDQFQESIVHRLVHIFGETPRAFYQHSHVHESSGKFDV